MKLTVTMQIDATLGKNVDPSKVAEVVSNAITRTVRDSAWVHLPGSKHKPLEKIALEIKEIDVQPS